MTAVDPKPLRVVIAEDHALLREGMARLLEDCGVEVVAQTGDPFELITKVGTYRPDVAVTDVQVQRGQTEDGMLAALRIRAEHPEVGVLVLSRAPDERAALMLIGEDCRRVGYLHKDRIGDVSTFVDAIARVARGESAVDRGIVAELLERARDEFQLERLKPRERKVLAMMTEGRSNEWIAQTMRVSLGAVEQHVAQVFAKLAVEDEPDEEQRVAALLRLLESC